MADYILQKDDNVLTIEQMIIKEKLDALKFQHSYKEMSLYELKNAPSRIELMGMIPIGTIEFVTTYLHDMYGVEKENPIEIPEYLRKEEFLHRDYKITTWDNIPRNGRYFVKNASRLKDFSYLGEMNNFITDDIFCEEKDDFESSLRLSKNDLYVVSSEFDAKAEYRVYVIDNKIEAIACYNGSCLLMPDVAMLNKAVYYIHHNEQFLKSYTIDIMVNKEETAIIEIHNFTSVGLYTTMFGDNLLYAYKDGIDYLLDDNKEIKIG